MTDKGAPLPGKFGGRLIAHGLDRLGVHSISDLDGESLGADSKRWERQALEAAKGQLACRVFSAFQNCDK
jgi:hypothetical protein